MELWEGLGARFADSLENWEREIIPSPFTPSLSMLNNIFFSHKNKIVPSQILTGILGLK